MNDAKCIVTSDIISCGGIIIKEGTISDILEDYGDILWINPYIPEIGEEIPLPVFRSNINYL